MIASFDYYNRFEEPIMSLRKPSNEFLNFIDNIKDFNISPEFNAISELHCSVYKFSEDNIEMSIYSSIEVKKQLFLEGVGYFIITEVTEHDSTEDGEYKSITALSCEHELSYKKLTYFNPDKSYKFWDSNAPSESLFGQIMKSLPRWSVGHIDASVANLYRSFDEPDTTVYAFLLDNVEKSYECIVEFDIIDRIINVYDKKNYIHKTSILLSKSDVISSSERANRAENVFTALTLYGDDELTINAANPLGTATVYDFSYYKSWMSDGLRQAVNDWEEKISNAQDRLLPLRISLAKKQDEYQAINTQIYSINEAITNLEKQMGADVSNETFTTLSAQIKAKRTELDEQEELESKKAAEMDTIDAQLEAIYLDCSFEENFNESLILELDSYIYEASEVDDTFSITDNMTYEERYNMINDLYNKAKSMLSDISTPTDELSISTTNFVFQKEFLPYTEQLETGRIIDIIDDNDIVTSYVLLKMDINYSEKTIDLTFGNKYRSSSAESLWNNWEANITDSANTLNYERSKYGKAVKSGSLDKMNMFMKSSLDLTLNKVKSSDGQSFELTDSGIKGRRINPDNGNVDPEQIWVTSNNVLFTDDAWESIKTAIGRILLPDGTYRYGINAELIMGNLMATNKLIIGDPSGNFYIDEDGVHSDYTTSSDIDDILAKKKMVKAVSVKYYISDSSTELIGSEWIEDEELGAVENGKYIWSKTVTTYTDDTINESSPICITSNAVSNYTWIKYADTPTSGMSDNPTGKKYMGLAVNKQSAAESTAYSDYQWSLLQGADGKDGADGIPGTNGVDGKTYYTWIKYADDANGTNMSDSPTDKEYIGIAYNKETSVESNRASDYTWALYKGSDGINGSNGRGISSITNHYLATSFSSGITTSTSGWTTDVQTISSSKPYLWNYEVTLYTDNTISTSQPCIIGRYGDTGLTGTSISSITKLYKKLNTKEQQPTPISDDGWTSIPPIWENGYYIHTCSKIIYKDPPSIEYTVPICDSSWEAVNEIQVGGRNLWVKNKTSLLNGATIESLEVNHVTGQTECYKIINGSTVEYNIEPDYSSKYCNKKITLSAWIKYDNVVVGTNTWNCFNAFKFVEQYKASSTETETDIHYPTMKVITGTKDWHKISYTRIISPSDPYDHVKFRLRFSVEGATSGTAWVTGIKVEFGNKATDWTPAPEDIDTGISNAQTSANNAQNTANNASTKADTALNNASSANATLDAWRYYTGDGTRTYINGGKIYTGTITADKLNVNTLSAITANLGTVTAGVLQSANYVSGTSGMKLTLSNGVWDSKYFKIASDGKITATGGTIGGWNVTSESLQSVYDYDGKQYILTLKNVTDPTDDMMYIETFAPGAYKIKGWSVDGYGRMHANNLKVTNNLVANGIETTSINDTGTLNVSGDTTLQSNCTILGNLKVNISLDVYGKYAVCHNNLIVGGDTFWDGYKAHIHGGLIAEKIQTTSGANLDELNSNLATRDYIVEGNKNSNGAYIKWNSGIMEQWYIGARNMAINHTYGSLFQNTITWTFPQSFIDIPFLCICPRLQWGTGASWGVLYEPYANSAMFRAFDVMSRAGGTTNCCFYARGYWK